MNNKKYLYFCYVSCFVLNTYTSFNTFTVRKSDGDISMEDIHTFLVYGPNPTA